jgi:hypothetical protein
MKSSLRFVASNSGSPTLDRVGAFFFGAGGTGPCVTVFPALFGGVDDLDERK